MRLTWLAVSAIIVEAKSGGKKAPPSLFPLGHSAVEELEPDAMQQLASHASDARYTTAILFYAPWCPHCQHFAPVYEKVAEAFVGDSRLRVCAVDCVANHATCLERKIHNFPTMQLFHAPAIPASMNEAGAEVSSKELGKGLDWILDYLKKSMAESAPDNSEAVTAPLTERDESASASGAVVGSSRHLPIRRGSSSSGSSSAIVKTVHLGKSGAIPAGPAAPAAPERAAHALADGSGHEPLRPSLLLRSHSGSRWSEWTDTEHSPARARLADAAASLLFGLQYGVFVEGPELQPSQREALVSFLTVLSQALPGPYAHREALKALLARVKGTSDNGQDDRAKVSTGDSSGKSMSKSGGVVHTDSEWQALLSSWQLGWMGKDAGEDSLEWTANCDPSKRIDGSSSSGGDSGDGGGRHITSGYTCGLWTLFHMLTMGAPRAGLSPGATMAAIRTYVEHFFGCAHCRDHFLSMYDSCAHGRCEIDAEIVPPPPPSFTESPDPASGRLRTSVGGGSDGTSNANAEWVAAEDAYQRAHDATAIWLWRTHNAVNVRVAADALRDEAERGETKAHPGDVEVVDLDPAWALWPSQQQCPECWKADQPSAHKFVGRDEDGSSSGSSSSGSGDMKAANRGNSDGAEWNKKAVLRFLKEAYDAGLWRETKPLPPQKKLNGPILISSVAQMADSVPEGLNGLHDQVLSSWEESGPATVVVVVSVAVLVGVLCVRWVRQRKRARSGAHKKVRSY